MLAVVPPASTIEKSCTLVTGSTALKIQGCAPSATVTVYVPLALVVAVPVHKIFPVKSKIPSLNIFFPVFLSINCSTSTYLGANEIQSITTSALIRPEIQTITTSTQQVQEEQKITVTADGGTYFIEFDTSPQGGSLQYSGDLSFNFPASGTLDGNNVADTLSSMSNTFNWFSMFKFY
jgi:hypothetical protein